MTTLERMELLELADGETRSFHFTSWEEGTVTIVPTWKPDGKEIKALRVGVRPQEKPLGPPYWDITSQTLIAQLLPYLQRDDFRAKTFTITKYGVPPKARFKVEIV